MSLFSRRARWLNDLFPASVAPQSSDPSRLSEEVSLVQPYDGSGWDLVNPDDWITTLTLAVGASGNENIRRIDDRNVFRFLSVDVILVAGLAPTSFRIRVTANGVEEVAVTGNVIPLTDGSAIRPVSPIIGPSTRILAVYVGGDVLTQIRVNLYGLEVPLGSVFYV